MRLFFAFIISVAVCFSLYTKDFSKSRKLQYYPEADGFVSVNGTNKFTRAIYGVYSGFRLETSDTPEFGLYLPGMGGNLTFAIEINGKRIELNNAAHVESRYIAGRRDYRISDPRLGEGVINISALVTREQDGAIIEVAAENIAEGTSLCWHYGGVSGKMFFRNGDLGRDAPDSFSLKTEYCVGNIFKISDNLTTVESGNTTVRLLSPPKSEISVDSLPSLHGKILFEGTQRYYFALYPQTTKLDMDYTLLSAQFDKAENDRAKLASALTIKTPDDFMNPIGGALAVAADGLWSGKAWLHGAVGWREPFSGWRGAYVGDVIGWHDRARTHFNTYRDNQIQNIKPTISHPTQDSAANLARAKQQWGTQMYSNGYICRRPGHTDEMSYYDMNLCYIDELLWHIRWTGDTDYVKEIWSMLTLHLDWEKRNFDPDNDGLYDAYCCIWASDALYYNSGAVTHSSAYNYRANLMAAQLATLIGENAEPYKQEADKILNAMNSRLWLSDKGHWAEYQDFIGYKRVHESAALWTIYHAIDSHTADPFQAYQAMRYVDSEIPHIQLKVDGSTENYALVSTTSWSPYAWSINNVALPELAHTALAYWQAGRNETAFSLLKSAFIDYMYLGSSPGNFGLNSYYDIHTGEVYRDFADPVGVCARAIVEGLFGIMPDMINDRLIIKPGFPQKWNDASISTSDISFTFQRSGNVDRYEIEPRFKRNPKLQLNLNAQGDNIKSLRINGKKTKWKVAETSVGTPVIEIEADTAKKYSIEIEWSKERFLNSVKQITATKGERITIPVNYEISDIYDPQHVVCDSVNSGYALSGRVNGKYGARTLFIKHRSGKMEWWQPVHIMVEKPTEEVRKQFANVIEAKCETVNIDRMMNDSVSKIFRNEYLSPRSPYTTLQITKYGAGEWCRPLEIPEIDDSGLRRLVKDNMFRTSLGVPFRTFAEGNNVAFTSLWDNFPSDMKIELEGRATNIYLLMAGSTNHMQSHIANGVLTVEYSDGSRDSIELINPDNWCTIDQDVFANDYAFARKTPLPYRLHLKSGIVSQRLADHIKLSGLYGHTIESGASMLLDIPTDGSKNLKSLTLETMSNDVIIGIMSVTLQRK